MVQDGRITARSGDAQPEHVADAAKVSAAGVQFVQDSVFTERLG